MIKGPPNEAVAQYLERVEALYRTVQEEWLPAIDPHSSVTRGHHLVDEELSGPYDAPTLDLHLGNGITIHLVPRGCYVIAAAGRLDFESKLGQESTVYLEGAPAIETEAGVGSQGGAVSEKGFGNPREAGWAWVQNKASGELPILNRGVFERLIGTLSE